MDRPEGFWAKLETAGGGEERGEDERKSEARSEGREEGEDSGLSSLHTSSSSSLRLHCSSRPGSKYARFWARLPLFNS